MNKCMMVLTLLFTMTALVATGCGTDEELVIRNPVVSVPDAGEEDDSESSGDGQEENDEQENSGTENDESAAGNDESAAGNDESGDNTSSGDENNSNENNESNEEEMMTNRKITIRVGNHSFAATIEDHATGRAFLALLPMTVTMNELNGNEKYYYLSESLPVESTRPGIIRNGDLMLYGSSCVVLFYETFSSSYSYTRIGKIDDPSGLAAALGTGNVTLKFEINEE